jgi:hypothetical protein
MLITTTIFHQLPIGSIVKHGTGTIPKLREGRTMYVAVKVSNGWVLKYGAALLGKEDIAKDGKICHDIELSMKLMAFIPEISGLFKQQDNG